MTMTTPIAPARVRDTDPLAKAASDQVTVLLVDDHALIRAGLQAALERGGDVDVVGGASTWTRP